MHTGKSDLIPMSISVQWNGYTIPKGALIRPSLWSVAMDPEVFPDPDQFDPTRFIDDERKSYWT